MQQEKGRRVERSVLAEEAHDLGNVKVIELLITSRQLGYKNINSKSIMNLSHISYTRDK